MTSIITALIAFLPFLPGQPLGPCKSGYCASGVCVEADGGLSICAPYCDDTSDCEGAFPDLNNIECSTRAHECWVLCEVDADCHEGAICHPKGLCLQPE